MTIEDPRHALIAGQAPAHVEPGRWPVAAYRCPCGFAGDDASEFDRHLDGADGAEPEHFEVLGGWTLAQVRDWQAAAVAPDAGVAVCATTAS
jgi:hypothetical protein